MHRVNLTRSVMIFFFLFQRRSLSADAKCLRLDFNLLEERKIRYKVCALEKLLRYSPQVMGDSFFRHVTPSLRSGTLLARNYIKTYLSDSCHNVLEHNHIGQKFEKKHHNLPQNCYTLFRNKRFVLNLML